MSRFTLNSRVRDLMDDPAARAEVVRLAAEYLPGTDLEKVVRENRLLYSLLSRKTLAELLALARAKAPGAVPADAEKLAAEVLAKLG